MEHEDILFGVSQIVTEINDLKKKLEKEKLRLFNSHRFYNVALTTKEVAKLHSVSPKLVAKYIKIGVIDAHPNSTDHKMLVRASDALLLDFKMLKFLAKERHENN